MIKQIYHALRDATNMAYLSPLWLLIRVHPKHRMLLDEERHWLSVLFPDRSAKLCSRIELYNLREYRTAIYYRIGETRRLIAWLIPGQYACQINCPQVGRHFILHHAHSTRIGARRVGDNVEIWQNVTIGHQHPTDLLPIIGNDVKIGCGAIVVGSITVGDGAVIGAGAVVVKDVPDGAVMVGNPARNLKDKQG